MRRCFLILVPFLLLIVLLGCPQLIKNNPPVWSTIPNATVNVGQSVQRNLSNYATDPDGDALTFSKVGGPGNVVGSQYSWTATGPYGEVYDVSVKASDGKGGEAVTTFTITVNTPPNTPSNPSPAHMAANQNYPGITLSWTGGDPDGDSVVYDIYFGTTDPLPRVKQSHHTTSYPVSGLQSSTTYYWQIVAKDGMTETPGPVWEFSTKAPQPPNTPSNPVPANNALKQNHPNITLSWTGGHPGGDPVVYDVYFGTNAIPPLEKSNHGTESYAVSGLTGNTTYYWQIRAKSGTQSVWGPIWQFKTGPVMLIDDDFESYIAGFAPNVPWGTYSFEGTSKAWISLYGRGGGQALTFEDPTVAGWAEIKRTTGWNNFSSCRLEYDFYVSTGGSFGVRLYAFGGYWEPYIFVGDRGQGWGLYAVNGNLNFKFLSALTPQTWYTVTVQFSYETYIYNVYLNGVYIGNQTITGPINNHLYGIQVLVFDDQTCNFVDIDNISLAVYDTGYTAEAIDYNDLEAFEPSVSSDIQ